MVEFLIFLAIVFHWRADERAVAAKVALLVASVFLGVLLALFGQTYQTGADPWQLFFFWAVLITPWAIIGRFPALWNVWLSLLNIAIALYCSTFRGTLVQFDTDLEQHWVSFACNSLALAAWEYLSSTHRWLAHAWASRLIACASGVPITIIFAYRLMELRQTSIFSLVAWITWLAIMYVVYRRIKPDLFMLAGCCLSIIAVVFSFAIKMMIEHSMMEGLLLLALLTVAMGAGAAGSCADVAVVCEVPAGGLRLDRLGPPALLPRLGVQAPCRRQHHRRFHRRSHAPGGLCAAAPS